VPASSPSRGSTCPAKNSKKASLLIQPWVEMIRDPQRLEAGLLGQLGLPDQVDGIVFF